MTTAPISSLYLSHILYRIPQIASQDLIASIFTSTRARLSLTQILLCFLGSGIFILLGTLTINYFQKKQRPRK